MHRERAVYLIILLSLLAISTLVFLGFKNAEAVKDGTTYFFTGSTKEKPFCFSWAKCPSASEPDAAWVSAPMPTSAPGPALPPEPAPRKPTPTVEPTVAPTPLPTATPEPEPVLQAFPVEEPDSTPNVRIPPIQWHPKPLEDNSHPTEKTRPQPGPTRSSGPSVPPALFDEPSPSPAVTPTRVPLPPRQFNEGDIVRWVSGGGWINEGQVQSAELNSNSNRWEYDVLRADGSVWKNLEENRMSLVIAGVTAPYQPQVEGLTVLWGDIDGAAGKGVVENSILDPATGGWMYDIRLANGDLIRTSPTVRILLVNGLAEDEPEPTPTPVPTATPTPVPTPTPEPTATPEAPADESEAPTPTPTPVPPEEEPTTTPTSEPEEEPTPAPGPDEEQDTITKPMPEPVILYHRVPVIEEYNQGAATEYIFNTFTLSGEDPDCCSPISSIDGGLVVTGDSVRWYVRASYNEYATQLDEPAIECHRGTRLWPWRFDGTMEFLESGCLGDPNDLVGLDYPHNMRITRYSGGETFSNEQTSTWTIEVEDSDGAYHSLGTIEFGFREDEPVEMRTDSGTSSCKDLNEDALGNRYPFSCSELGLKNSTPKPDEEESTTEQVEEGEEEETTSDSTPESEESEKEPEDETAPEPEPEKYLTLTRDLQVREFIQGVTGSQYIFSSVTAVYKVVNDADQQHITVGLVAEPDEAKPRWYVSSSSESGDRNVRCIEGSAIWESNIDDDETQGGGCIGDADFLAFDTPYTIEITPFSESDDDGWSVLINGTHVADIVDDDVDHSQDSFLRDYPITNAYSCTELSGYPPRSDCS